MKASYEEQTDIRYAAARLWVDAIIEPGADASGAADGPGGRDAARRRPGVQDGRVAGVSLPRQSALHQLGDLPGVLAARARRPR